MSLSGRGLLVMLLVMFGMFMHAPLLHHLGWRGLHSLVVLVAGIGVLMVFGGGRLRPPVLLFALAPVGTSLVAGLYWQDPRYLGATALFVVAVLLVQFADRVVLERFATMATIVVQVMLAGAVVGFAAAAAGVGPLFEFANPDGRPNRFYYTTFSNSVFGVIIRPAGIYDEPGAFSFFICATAALRHLLGRDNRVTWLMLGFGFITLSLAHLIYVLVHLLAERLDRRSLGGMLAVLVLAGGGAVSLGMHDVLNERLIARMTITEAGELAGDNRSWRMLNAWDHLQRDPRSLLFGADPSCQFDYEHCKRIFPLMGENPLAPAALRGLLVTWPYYLLVSALLAAPVLGRRYLVIFGMGLLFLQRPAVMLMGYSLWAVLLAGLLFAAVSDRVAHATPHSARIRGNTALEPGSDTGGSARTMVPRRS